MREKRLNQKEKKGKNKENREKITDFEFTVES